MQQEEKQVLVIGGGVAGLTAAHALARDAISVHLVEKAGVLGGHAIQYACKATDACVKCGACLAGTACRAAEENPRIHKRLNSRIIDVSPGQPYAITLSAEGPPASQPPALVSADAVILATGFSPFRPSEKPYGWGRFPNVITNLELEHRLLTHGAPLRPSDDAPAEKIAFIQCVGSRDAGLGHLWCSKICCGSALRMARWIRSRRPDTEVHFFYIDVQTFGKNFHTVYDDAGDAIRMVRIIPSDVIPIPGDRLQLGYFDPVRNQGVDETVDLVVLSIGMMPGPNTAQFSDWFGAGRADTGFFHSITAGADALPPGVFTAGAATGPMSIPEAIASGQQAALYAHNYLSGSKL